MGGQGTERLTFVDSGAHDVFQANARNPRLVREVIETGSPVLMTAVWGDTHLDVGWFDDVDACVDLDAARRLGVQVVRRYGYGGGTAFYDKGCASVWSFMLPKGAFADLDAALARFRPVMEDTLARLDLGEVAFEGSMDLRWRGRKLGAMPGQDVGVADIVGGFLNLRPPDLDLYLKIARVPDDKFKDKIVKDMREYVVGAEEIRGRPLPYEELRDALLQSVKAAGFDVEERPLEPDDDAALAKVRGRMGSDENVRRVSSERFRAEAGAAGHAVGIANHKGRKLVRAGIAVDAEGCIASAMMAGDLHVAPPDVLDRVAAALVGARADDDDDLRGRIASVFDGPDVHQADAAMGVTTDDLLTAVREAFRHLELGSL